MANILNRRKKMDVPDLEITPFLNLMVALVAFLLNSAVFSEVKLLDLKLPPPGAGAVQDQQKLPYQLQIVIRDDALEVGDNRGGLIKRVPAYSGGYDYKMLSEVLQMVKQRMPDKTDIMILAQPTTSYDVLVQIMDSTRMFQAMDNGAQVDAELFPDISIGDAP